MNRTKDWKTQVASGRWSDSFNQSYTGSMAAIEGRTMGEGEREMERGEERWRETMREKARDGERRREMERDEERWRDNTDGGVHASVCVNGIPVCIRKCSLM